MCEVHLFYVKIKTALGKYASDYDFWLPKLVFVFLRVFPSQLHVGIEIAQDMTLKNKDAWYRALSDFRSQIKFNPKSI